MSRISPKVDIAFKKIFGVEENQDLLIWLCFFTYLWIHKLNFSATNDKVSISSEYYCDMPYKYPDDRGWKVPKQKYKLTNW
jgi:hypothetical protein